MPLTTVNHGGILDGTIINADIAANAAIDASKITGLELGQLNTSQTITSNKTIPATTNALMVGDVALNSGVEITIHQTSKLIILG